MKTRTLILALAFIVGIIATSCGSSNHTCPAYSQDSNENVEVEKS